MLAKKIIKFYFCLVIAAVSLATIPHMGDRQDFMANVLGVGGSGVFSNYGNDFSAGLYIKVNHDPAYNYASPGSNRNKSLDIVIGNTNTDLELKDLKVKILNVNPLAIEKAVLMDEENSLLKARRKNEYLIFENVGLKIPKGSTKTISVALNLNDNLNPGQRIKLQIENSADFVLLAEKIPINMSALDFPMESPYLTVVKQKPKFKVIYK